MARARSFMPIAVILLLVILFLIIAYTLGNARGEVPCPSAASGQSAVSTANCTG